MRSPNSAESIQSPELVNEPSLVNRILSKQYRALRDQFESDPVNIQEIARLADNLRERFYLSSERTPFIGTLSNSAVEEGQSGVLSPKQQLLLDAVFNLKEGEHLSTNQAWTLVANDGSLKSIDSLYALINDANEKLKLNGLRIQGKRNLGYSLVELTSSENVIPQSQPELRTIEDIDDFYKNAFSILVKRKNLLAIVIDRVTPIMDYAAGEMICRLITEQANLLLAAEKEQARRSTPVLKAKVNKSANPESIFEDIKSRVEGVLPKKLLPTEENLLRELSNLNEDQFLSLEESKKAIGAELKDNSYFHQFVQKINEKLAHNGSSQRVRGDRSFARRGYRIVDEA